MLFNFMNVQEQCVHSLHMTFFWTRLHQEIVTPGPRIVHFIQGCLIQHSLVGGTQKSGGVGKWS
jgi:hypothetical protein